MNRRAVGSPTYRPLVPPVGQHSRHSRDLVFSVVLLLTLFIPSWLCGFALMLLIK